MTPLRLVAPAVLAALAIAGCGGAEDDAGPAAKTITAAQLAAPATGSKLVGTGYMLRLARGWREVTGDPALAGIDYEVAAVNKVESSLDVSRNKDRRNEDAKILEEVVRLQAKGAKATSTAPIEPFVLDGRQGIRLRFRAPSDRGPAAFVLVAAYHDGYIYEARFAGLVSDLADDGRDFDAMLSSWQWAG